MHEPSTSTKKKSVLAALRSLVPECEIGFQHVLKIAERHADELLRLYGHADGPTPTDVVTKFPRVKVVYRTDLPTSGASRWNGSQWVIFLRGTDCHTRQRFTLCHELAHVIQHASLDSHITGKRFLTDEPNADNAKRQRERAADHFAGCLLMPRTAVFAAWTDGLRTPEAIADRLDVSTPAARVRLEQLELIRPRWMCSRGATSYDGQPAPTAAALRRMRTLGLRNPRRPHLTAPGRFA